MGECYISVDIEADGPIPGPNSMLSFGAAAYTAEGKRLSVFTANLEPLEGAQPHPDTMAWWNSTPDNQRAYQATRVAPDHPGTAMATFTAWVESLPGRPVFVGYPVAYDFMWMYWYLMRFEQYSPFSHSGLDMKTMAMVMLKLDFRGVGKRVMAKRWPTNHPHTHLAMDDAIEQGEMFCQMLKELQQ